ncbi:MAG TPA: hypothetical protein VHN37_08835 [Actinomycetota bacterium]|nr:hypothetical protein [Actinomycetota bacterium]
MRRALARSLLVVLVAAPACGPPDPAAAPECVDGVLTAYRATVEPATELGRVLAGGRAPALERRAAAASYRAAARDAAEVARECAGDAETRCRETLEALETGLRAAAEFDPAASRGDPATAFDGRRAQLEGAAAEVVNCDTS